MGEVNPGPDSGAQVSLWFWVVSCSAIFGMVACVDVALGGEGRSPEALFWTAALGGATGLLHGAFLGLAFRILRRRHRVVHALAWLLLALLAVLWPMEELGVFERLTGQYRHLAVLVMVGLVVAGTSAALLFLSLQPTPSAPRGWLGERSKRTRLICAAVLMVASVATLIVDRTFYQGGYAIAHLFLQVGGLWCLFLATVLPSKRAPQLSSRAGLSYLGGVFVLLAVTGTTLTSNREGELGVMLDRPYAALALETVRGLTDFDLDGYSYVLGGGDCAPLSAQVNPAAAEVPGNGLDDNCRLGDAPTSIDSPSEMVWPEDASPTSVVLITVDTLAAPYMSLYGGKKHTSPGIDKWAEAAAVFERAYTTGGWTSLAISSMMRGVYPRRLKWTRLFETTDWRLLTNDQLVDLREGERLKQMFGLPLDDPRITLPTWLSLRGMSTRAVVNDGQSEFLDPAFQAKGFDQFVDMDTRAKRSRATDREVTGIARKVLDGLAKKKAPFFLWVHYFGPHLPDSRHPKVRGFGSDPVGKYEHEVAALDRELSPLLKRLDALGKKRKIAVILTSDHGEVIDGTGRGHGRKLVESGIRVPLVIKAERFETGRYAPPVSLVDIYPTIAALTDSPMPKHIDGVDLARIVAGEPELASRTLITETWGYRKNGKLRSEHVAAFDGHRKLTIDMRTQARTLRDQAFPEDEKQNLIKDGTKNFEALEEALERHLEAGSSATFVR